MFEELQAEEKKVLLWRTRAVKGTTTQTFPYGKRHLVADHEAHIRDPQGSGELSHGKDGD